MLSKLLFAVLTFLTSVIYKCHGESADQCTAQQPIYGKALIGFTFNTLQLTSEMECLVHCHYEDRCQSYNYVTKTNICEMNNRTKEAKPEQFVPDPDRFYAKRGAHRKQLGSIPTLPAQSCKEIKDNEGGQAVSSNSWLDPTGSGEIILAYCDMNTQVADFCIRHRCQNGATCVNGHVNYTCLCNGEWSGTFCESSARSFKSCSHLKMFNSSAESGNYVIDPDGEGGLPPLYDVTCDMTDKNGVGVTVISHDSEARTHVIGYEESGSYSRDIEYNGATFSQLASLADVASHCEQFVKYECKSSFMFKFAPENYEAWWVSRDSVQMTYWGGAEPGSGKCACGMNNTCADASKACNCDKNDDVWREDSGLLTDKTHLPVIQLRFGDTGYEGEEGYHTLGKFKCYGIAGK